MLTPSEEKQFRGWVRQILESADQNNELLTEGELSDAFVKPFANVFNVAKVALKDVLTVAKFNFDMLVTFDPVKIANMKNNFKERRKNIKEDYAEAMGPVKASFGDDAKMVGFMLNPAGYLGGAALKAGINNAPDLVNYFKEAGFGAGGVGGSGPSDKEKKRSGKKIKKPVGVVGTVIKGLRKLFYIDEASRILPDGVMLLEQDEKGDAPEEGGGGFNAQQATAEALESLGVLDWVAEKAKPMVEDAKKANEEFIEIFKSNIQVADALSKVDSYEALQKILEDAKTEGLDIAGSIEGLDGEIQEQVDKLIGEQESREAFIRAVAEKKGKAIPEDEPIPEEFLNTPEEDLKEEAFTAMFATGTEELRTKATEIKEKIIEQTKEEFEGFQEEFMEDYEIDDAMSKGIKGTPIGKDFMEPFETTLKELESA